MIRATYAINDEYEDLVANALPDAPNVRKELNNVAMNVMTKAKVNMQAAPRLTASDGRNVEEVTSQLGFLSAKQYFRKQVFPGTRIPVVLVISNAWQSKWYEFGKGSGNHFPALHFMRTAARSSAKKGILWRGRGRSRSAQ